MDFETDSGSQSLQAGVPHLGRSTGPAVLVTLLAALGPSLAAGLVSTLVPPPDRALTAVHWAAGLERHLSLDGVALRACGPRDLRRLPGIGSTRALAIARARWARGGRFPLEDWTSIRGIGAVTVDRCRSVLGPEGPPLAARQGS